MTTEPFVNTLRAALVAANIPESVLGNETFPASEISTILDYPDFEKQTLHVQGSHVSLSLVAQQWGVPCKDLVAVVAQCDESKSFLSLQQRQFCISEAAARDLPLRSISAFVREDICIPPEFTGAVIDTAKKAGIKMFVPSNGETFIAKSKCELLRKTMYPS